MRDKTRNLVHGMPVETPVADVGVTHPTIETTDDIAEQQQVEASQSLEDQLTDLNRLEAILITALLAENRWVQGFLWLITGACASWGINHIIQSFIPPKTNDYWQGSFLVLVAIILMLLLWSHQRLCVFYQRFKQAKHHPNGQQDAQQKLRIKITQLTREREQVAEHLNNLQEQQQKNELENERLQRLLDQMAANDINFANLLKQLRSPDDPSDPMCAQIAKQVLANDELLKENRELRETVREATEEVQRVSTYVEHIATLAKSLDKHTDSELREHLKSHELEEEDMEELDNLLEEIDAFKAQDKSLGRLATTASRLTELVAKTQGQAVAKDATLPNNRTSEPVLNNDPTPNIAESSQQSSSAS